MKLKVDFNGGLDELFDKQKNIEVEVDKDQVTIEELILVLK